MSRPLSIGARGVAACVIDGLKRHEIAAATGMTAAAVKGHMRTLQRRFDIHNLPDLASRLMWCDWARDVNGRGHVYRRRRVRLAETFATPKEMPR